MHACAESFLQSIKSEITAGGSVLTAARFLDGGERVVRVLVAAARAVLQFHDGVQNLGSIHLLVRIRLERTGVTTRAIRLVGSEFPGNDFTVRGMAGSAGYA